MITLYHTAVLILIGVLVLTTVVNVLTVRTVRRGRHSAHAPMISVLVPARNEERAIAACLATLVEQDYPSYEVLVLDDGSEDGTAAVVRQWAERSSRVRLLDGAPLPGGWAGKAHACHQLARAARGELLLFVDADTALYRHALSAAEHERRRTGADLLTLIPQQRAETAWEKILLPLLHFYTFAFLPLPLVAMLRSPRFAMANGQFMLFRREAYEAVGGHAAVRTALVEDVWLSRLIKAHGFRLRIADGSRAVICRMYTSFEEIWNGFSKNLFAGFNYSIPAMAAVIAFNAATSVLPFLLFAWGLAAGATGRGWFFLVSLQVAGILAVRLMLAQRFRTNLVAVLYHPAAVQVMLAVAVNSILWVVSRGGARWKGRSYDFRHFPVHRSS